VGPLTALDLLLVARLLGLALLGRLILGAVARLTGITLILLRMLATLYLGIVAGLVLRALIH